MHAIVVYESHWGNTAAVARAIADGLGPEARALTTDEAVGPALEGVDLIVPPLDAILA
jgi:flavodoxin